jgi:D-tagatose-1,6-bisphosphate aldolase subunit GatZ/KbaZ
MNAELRQKAARENLPVLDYILKIIKNLESETGIRRTIFAACPNSISVIKAALRSAKRNNAPIMFAATLNQVDTDGGYTKMTQKQFVNTTREEARLINLKVPVIIAIDHGGPWLKDVHTREKWSYSDSMNWVKKSFEAAVEAGYDLIHVDPTIDISLPKKAYLSIKTVADRTLELIEHTEMFRRKKGFQRISYEVGTEEVHGGLADLSVFKNFMEYLKNGLKERGLLDSWPCFVVGKVGTDLHTTTFDPQMAEELTSISAQYGSVIKGHYSDNVSNPEDYPKSGMGAANVGPEFTECEYEGLIELMELEKSLDIPRLSNIKEVLWNAVIDSDRWKKWLQTGESDIDFYKNDPLRQRWLIKTGCRYIWENPEVIASRVLLNNNLEAKGINVEEILLSYIERGMDKYFNKFNLIGLNKLLIA